MVIQLLLLVLLGAPALALDDAAVAPLPAGSQAAALTSSPVELRVTATNTGSTVWTKADGYKLIERSGSFGATRVELADADMIFPGASKTFLFVGQAPAQPGAYPAQFQMAVEQGTSVLWLGQPSDPWTVQVSASAPPAPTGLKAVVASAHEIDLSWAPAVGAAQVRVERREGSATSSSFAQLALIAGTATSYADASALPSTSYAYRLEALNASGQPSAPSAEATAATPATSSPVAPPKISSVTAVSSSSTTETISFLTDIPAFGRVAYGTTTGYDALTPQDAGGTAHNIVLSGLAVGVAYHFQVQASTAGLTATMGDFTFTTAAPPGPATALTARALSRSAIVLAWLPGANQLGVNVERSTDSASWTRIDGLGASATTYLAAGLSAGTRYFFRLESFSSPGGPLAVSNTASAMTFAAAGAPCVAADGSFAYPWSTAALAAGAHRLKAVASTDVATASTSVSVTIILPPQTPGNVSVSTVSSTELAVRWTPASGAPAEYRVERGLDGTSFAQVAVVAGGASSSWQDSGLSPSTRYYYRVSAANAAGASAPSAAASAVTPAPPPLSAPGGLTATASSASRIDLAWSAVAGAAVYKIERSLDGASYSPATALAATGWSDIGLNPNTLYYYRVRASNAQGDSAPSAAAQARTPDVPPAAPVGVAAALSGTSIRVSWTLASTNETSVKVQRSAAGGAWTDLVTLAARAQAYTDATAQGGVSSSYRVIALNSAGASNPSAPSNAVTVPAPPPVLQCAGKLSSFTYSWNTLASANGPHKLWVKAYAASGAVAVSTAVNVTVNNTAPAGMSIAAATLAFSALPEGATVLGTVRLAAAVSAPAAVARLEFYDNGQLVGSSDSAAKRVAWDTTPAPGPHTLTVVAYDAGGGSKTATTRVSVIPPSELALSSGVTAAAGGVVGDARTLQVEFDDAGGAMPEDAVLDIRPEDTSNTAEERLKRADETARGLSRAGLGVEITARGKVSGADIHHFKRPVTLRFGYAAAPTAAADSRVGLFFWDVGRKTWQAVPGTAQDGVLVAQTDHLTTYAVFSVASPLGASGKIQELFVYPNPLVGGRPGTVHAEVGAADEFSVGVYDLAGRLVRSGSVAGPPRVGINGKPAYEYTWDTGGLGSGSYLCLVRARSGGTTVTGVKKFAVIK